MLQKEEVLQRTFGYSAFRPGQGELIDHIMAGGDALGVMPTGAGKSLCYQVPALMLPGVTLVVSPLISLMKDQVGALVQAGVRAAYLNSSLTPGQYQKAFANLKAGLYKIVYIAPERLLGEGFLSYAKSAVISQISVDEAHCVSQWGQDFRPSYLKIPQFVEQLPVRPVLTAFTATATGEVRRDIADKLGLRAPFCLTTGFDRKNLSFAVRQPRSKLEELQGILRENRDKSGIVYCSTRKNVDMVFETLLRAGWACARYHAGLSEEERRRSQDDFLFDRIQVMVATNAFGMGIDKSNVSFVIHYNMPLSLENYYQEAGRAGRDGSPAECILLFSPQDVATARFLIDHSEENEALSEEERDFARARSHALLQSMESYCRSTRCLRGDILRYFGEEAPAACGNCGNCREEFEELDISQEARLILECARQTRGRFGSRMLSDILRGKWNERIGQWGLDELPSYGRLSGLSEQNLRQILLYLKEEGYLNASGGEYPTLRAGGRSLPSPLTMRVRVEKRQAAPPKAKGSSGLDERGAGLYTRLRLLRGKLAAEQGVPAFVVFSDATLRDMCIRRPRTEAEFLQVSGVGEAKCRRYGKAFLTELNK